jgi:hypothetical protein
MFYPRAVEGGSKEKPEMLVYDHNTQGIPLTVDSPIMVGSETRIWIQHQGRQCGAM